MTSIHCAPAAIASEAMFRNASSIVTAAASPSKRPSGDGLSLHLDEGGIAFGGDCDTKTGVWVKPGSDDKVFDLEAAPLEVCRSLEKEQIDPWP